MLLNEFAIDKFYFFLFLMTYEIDAVFLGGGLVQE